MTDIAKPDQPAKSDRALYREEALSYAGGRLNGDVMLALPLSGKIAAVVAAIILVLVGIFVSIARYDRRERVEGWLIPEHGMIRVVASRGGRIDAALVAEGEHIRAGAPIARIRLSSGLETGDSAQERVAVLEAQIAAAERQRDAALLALEQEEVRLTGLLAAIATEQDLLTQQRALQIEQLRIAETARDRAADMQSRGVVSSQEQERRAGAALDEHATLVQLDRAENDRVRRQLEIETALLDLPLRREQTRADTDSRVEAINERILTIRSQGGELLVAPISAQIAALPVRDGQTLQAGGTVAVLVPDGDELVAELLVPSRAAGFIEVGQRVRLMYAAYPYQRFGMGEAVVSRVTTTVLEAGEVNVPGVILNEAVFRVEARLRTQSVAAYGQAIPLQPGMRLQADIVTDERRLVDWVLDPILAISRGE